MPEIKRVTLHPLKSDGTMDLNVNLYPKALKDGIVDREGNPVEIATEEQLNELSSIVDEKANKIGPLPFLPPVKNDNIVIKDYLDELGVDSITGMISLRGNSYLIELHLVKNINNLYVNMSYINARNTYYARVVGEDEVNSFTFGNLLNNYRVYTELQSNKVTSISSSSTDSEYPSAKAVWDVKGTKLYRHNIYIEDNDRSVRLHIINTSSIPYQLIDFNSNEKLFNIIITSTRIILQTFYVEEPVGQIVTMMFFNNDSDILNIGCYSDVYEEVSISYTTLEQFNDTVTEL